jgi:hypothetical protein
MTHLADFRPRRTVVSKPEKRKKMLELPITATGLSFDIGARRIQSPLKLQSPLGKFWGCYLVLMACAPSNEAEYISSFQHNLNIRIL